MNAFRNSCPEFATYYESATVWIPTLPEAHIPPIIMTIEGNVAPTISASTMPARNIAMPT